MNTKKLYYYMALARVAASQSTCKEAQVGCVLVLDDRIVATGYNGSFPGTPNCDGGLTCQSEHKGQKVCLTIHAEINAIQSALKLTKANLTGASAFVTRCPCLNCAQALIFAGVSKIYYLQKNSWQPVVEQFLHNQAPSYFTHFGPLELDPVLDIIRSSLHNEP